MEQLNMEMSFPFQTGCENLAFQSGKRVTSALSWCPYRENTTYEKGTTIRKKNF